MLIKTISENVLYGYVSTLSSKISSDGDTFFRDWMLKNKVFLSMFFWHYLHALPQIYSPFDAQAGFPSLNPNELSSGTWIDLKLLNLLYSVHSFKLADDLLPLHCWSPAIYLIIVSLPYSNLIIILLSLLTTYSYCTTSNYEWFQWWR